MDQKQEFLKARTRHLTLPSSIEIDYVLPSTGDLIQLTGGNITTEQVIGLIAKGLPEGVDISDLPIDDFAYLRDYIGNFFDKAAEPEAPTGSES